MTLKSAHISQSKGFTLIELLLGIVIISIIGVSVYNVFWSGMKLDDKMRRMHDNYLEVLIAEGGLTRDLENAVSLDLSVSYPKAKIFQGQKNEFSFLTKTDAGIKWVRYYSGMVDWGKTTKTIIGQRLSHLSSFQIGGDLPIEFLIREERNLADWANQTTTKPFVQIAAAGLKKGTFDCKYAPLAKDLSVKGEKGIVYSSVWQDSGVPMAVSCSFSIYDATQPTLDLKFKRDIFIPLVK
jgi:prepilin-type N-terminal cleavage/methylation domain-containing protein